MQKIDCGTYSRYAFHIADTVDFLSSSLKCSSQFFVIIFRTLEPKKFSKILPSRELSGDIYDIGCCFSAPLNILYFWNTFLCHWLSTRTFQTLKVSTSSQVHPALFGCLLSPGASLPHFTTYATGFRKPFLSPGKFCLAFHLELGPFWLR